MLNIGITGGIGSGKTTVCKIFEILDIPVYYADIRAKALMTENTDLVRNIKNLLGNESYFENGSLNRKYISNKVFTNQALLSQLNELVHPQVWKDADNWFRDQDTSIPYALNEAALLFETDSYKRFDKIITVTASKELRIKRVVERDGATANEVENRIKKQLNDEVKVQLSNFIIENENNSNLIHQVLNIHRKLINS